MERATLLCTRRARLRAGNLEAPRALGASCAKRNDATFNEQKRCNRMFLLPHSHRWRAGLAWPGTICRPLSMSSPVAGFPGASCGERHRRFGDGADRRAERAQAQSVAGIARVPHDRHPRRLHHVLGFLARFRAADRTWRVGERGDRIWWARSCCRWVRSFAGLWLRSRRSHEHEPPKSRRTKPACAWTAGSSATIRR